MRKSKWPRNSGCTEIGQKKRAKLLRSMFVDGNSLGPQEKKGLKKRRDVENYVSRQIILKVYRAGAEK